MQQILHYIHFAKLATKWRNILKFNCKCIALQRTQYYYNNCELWIHNWIRATFRLLYRKMRSVFIKRKCELIDAYTKIWALRSSHGFHSYCNSSSALQGDCVGAGHSEKKYKQFNYAIVMPNGVLLLYRLNTIVHVTALLIVTNRRYAERASYFTYLVKWSPNSSWQTIIVVNKSLFVCVYHLTTIGFGGLLLRCYL